MKQKINNRLVLIAFIAVIVTTIGITFVYYNLFQDQVKKDLRTEAELLVDTGIEGLIKNEAILNNKDIRITWIDADGVVLFDNDAVVTELANHMNRPEVVSAFTQCLCRMELFCGLQQRRGVFLVSICLLSRLL